MDSGIVKQAGCNKQAGWKFFVKQLSKQDLQGVTKKMDTPKSGCKK